MKYEAVYLPAANRDILKINEALISFPGKAKRLFQEIEKKVIMLEDLPYMWPEYHAKPEYRRMVLEDHLLFYVVDENERKIKIYRVLYGKMDISKLIT